MPTHLMECPWSRSAPPLDVPPGVGGWARGKGRAGTPVPGPNSSAPSGDGPGAGHSAPEPNSPPDAAGRVRERQHTERHPAERRRGAETVRGAADSPPAHASLPFTGWSGGAHERAQVGYRFWPRCALPRPGDVPRAAGPAGHWTLAGGYWAGSAGKRPLEAVGPAGSSRGQVTHWHIHSNQRIR
jgi:hypothetical protein